jgi:hypothetical protein
MVSVHRLKLLAELSFYLCERDAKDEVGDQQMEKVRFKFDMRRRLVCSKYDSPGGYADEAAYRTKDKTILPCRKAEKTSPKPLISSGEYKPYQIMKQKTTYRRIVCFASTRGEKKRTQQLRFFEPIVEQVGGKVTKQCHGAGTSKGRIDYFFELRRG